MNLARRIIENHIVEGDTTPGSEISLRIDQTLTQDATGTMAYLQLEAMGIEKIRTELSVSYVDHNLIQTDFRNADDHRYLESVAAKYGLFFSRPGNGVSHQVHLERFGRPGKTLLGSDSHTPTAGGLGMLAIGAGGLDVALAMAGQPFYMKMPEVLGVELKGKMPSWVSAKDIVLEVLRRLNVKGGVGKILEYYGSGVETLDVPSRAAICNMGTETGATSSIFPSDRNTKKFLNDQGRVEDWSKINPDRDAHYDKKLEINLSELEPLVAAPSSPGNVVKVTDLKGADVSQVLIGSCANSSLQELIMVARLVEGKTIHPKVSFEINPGSRQVLENLAASNSFLTLVKAGARIHQPGCLGCIGMGQAPATDTISLRTFPRNFPGRSGTKGDKVYLCSPEVAVAAALKGRITDPRELGSYPEIKLPFKLIIDDSMIIPPPYRRSGIKVVRGPNIKPLPRMEALPTSLQGVVLIKVGDNVSTDDVLPAGSEILPLRSNIPAISEHVFSRIQPGFSARARELGGGFVVGGENYGQGSSREHAALAPRYLGVKAVLAKSFARIHRSNLINFGVLPLEFKKRADYDRVRVGETIKIINIKKNIKSDLKEIPVNIEGMTYQLLFDSTKRERNIILAGGLLNFIRNLQH